MTWQIVYICIFAALTVTLIAMKLLNMSPRKRGVVKTVTSAAFVAAAVVGCVQKGGGLHILLAVGLLFAAAGDVLLVLFLCCCGGKIKNFNLTVNPTCLLLMVAMLVCCGGISVGNGK